MQLTIHDIRALPDSRHTLVELSIRTNHPETRPGGDNDAYNSIFQRANHQPLQIDIVDTSDRSIPWFQSIADAENSRGHSDLDQLESIGAAQGASLLHRWHAPRSKSRSSFPTCQCRRAGPDPGSIEDFLRE